MNSPILVTQRLRLLRTIAIVAFTALFVAPAALAAIPWDGGGGDGNWFNPANWNRNMNDNNTLPPGDSITGATDTEISLGTATLNGGQGVIYNPTNGAPFYPPADAVNDAPASFSYTSIRELYISRAGNAQAFVTPDNTVSILGDLELAANMIVGRSSGSLTTPTNGRVNQLDGLVKVHFNAIDLGQRENSGAGGRIGFGNGIYDYLGGSIEAGLQSGTIDSHGIRLAAGGSAGSGGIGRFIMHNPDTPGYVRALNYVVAASPGLAGNPTVSPNGTTIGVGIAEFRYENGGTRPIQVTRNLIINNGTVTTGTRSARLNLVLDEAPAVDMDGVPQTLGLFDVDFAFDSVLDNSNFHEGAISGTGSLGLFFSSADGSTLYTEGAEISATFGSTEYTWNITYQGKISWGTCDEGSGTGTACADADNGVVGTIANSGGNDVVLIGLSSVTEGIPGDYNDDGVVDAADYVTWRKNEGTMNTLPNDPNGGTIGTAQYNTWQTNFGAMAGAGAGSSLAVSGVPEPSALALVLIALCGITRRVRKSS